MGVTAHAWLPLGLLILALGAGWTTPWAQAQPGRPVKVVLDFQQRGEDSRQGVQGGGGVILREERGSTRARPFGGATVQDTTTRVTRSSGIFIVVADGGSGTLVVASEVPYTQAVYYHDYATARGYVVQGVAWQSVGTGLTVEPTVLPGGQIKLRITPRISYFTAGGGGSVELVDAASELIVPNGQKVQLAGATTGLHAVTRQILGYRAERAAGETALAVTATLQ